MNERSVDWRRVVLGLLAAAALLHPAPVRAQPAFPFDQEILLDVKPLPGSRRVPIFEIHANGKASIDLWCNSGSAEVTVTGNEIRFVLGPMREERCTPDRSERDVALAKALTEMTHWRLQDDIVTLVGPTTLRFRISTH